MNTTKKCSRCYETKPLDEFYKSKSGKYGKASECKKCSLKRSKKYQQGHKEEIAEQNKIWYENGGREKQGKTSMYKNKSCPQYLGIVIAERLSRHLFKDVEVMPHGNPGFDIICDRGKKINVKASCFTLQYNKYPYWKFDINHNKIADYFICVAFDNIEDLNPLHLWMIPGKEINNNASKSVRPSTIHKWSQWERDIKDAQLCCTKLKKENN